jgi:uncharacterized membrane protein YhfC
MRYELVGMSVLAALICVVIPIALAIVLRRRLGVRLWIFVLGALTFIASQVVHIPLMFGVDAAVKAWLPPPPPSWVWLTPVLLGFLAGVCEEPARWLAIRFAVRRDHERGREGAVMLGAGHGGVESMFIGVSVLLSLVNLVILREVDAQGLVTLSGGAMDEAAARTVVEQVQRYWAQPTWEPLLAAVERVLAIALHVSLSALVAHGVRRRALWPLLAAIAWHTIVNAIAVYGVQRWSPVMVELALAAMIVPVAVLLLTWTWRRAGPTLDRATASPTPENEAS